MKKTYKVNSLYDKLIWILTVLMLSSQIIYSKYSWSNLLLITIGISIFAIDNLAHNGSVIPLSMFQKILGLFVLYGFITSIWSISPSDSLSFSITLLYVLASISLIYSHYKRYNDIEPLKSVIIWSSIILALYSFYSFGFNGLIESSRSYHKRILDAFTNVNTISMFCALGIVLQFEKFLNERKINFQLLFVPLEVFLVACLQSRKALSIILIGSIMLLVLHNYKRKHIFSSFFKIVISLLVIIMIFYFLLELEIFEGMNERFLGLLSIFSNKSQVDSSSQTRMALFNAGVDIWRQYPIQGIGIGCSHFMVNRYLGIDTYLHNNYIELLCNTGTIGMSIYYSLHLYILINLIKYRKNNIRKFNLGITWILITLLMDFGSVSYYERDNIFYLMCQFINVQLLREDSEDGKLDDKKSVY
ncbi:O-antigen ligase family protein [Anaerococcus tetradius]|uniref:O-antigen ligase family protein n=1 Tax=Anaerococcus tetradius TaxID=33036 RepID=UPI0023F55E60|nr:O-antigen ligase family protein [Anaerococcus tetradius]